MAGSIVTGIPDALDSTPTTSPSVALDFWAVILVGVIGRLAGCAEVIAIPPMRTKRRGRRDRLNNRAVMLNSVEGNVPRYIDEPEPHPYPNPVVRNAECGTRNEKSRKRSKHVFIDFVPHSAYRIPLFELNPARGFHDPHSRGLVTGDDDARQP
jgi:hypothetical protein